MARFAWIVVGLMLIVVPAGIPVVGASAQPARTFALSISANDCDSNPRENQEAICAPSIGTVVSVSLDSGEFIGSCTLEFFESPNGGVGAACGVEGVPFNSSLVITEDPASLPAGYVPLDSPQTFEVGDAIPGGGDQTVISFINVLQEGLGGEPPPVYRATYFYGGTCEELSTEAGFYPLNPVVLAQGEVVGQSVAIEAETSNKTVDIPLDTLIDEPHAIAVSTTLSTDSTIIACGEIGGVNDHDGELIIGLREMNNSGFTGIARLAYNNEDAEKTDVAVYLAQGLADES
jgi:hypothetical protein